MKSYSADLIALLASNYPIYKADLFAIGPCLNGAMIYATSGKGAIAFGGNTYLSSSSGNGAWSRGSISVKIGLDSNSTKLTVFADNQVPVYFPGINNGALLMDGIKFGLLGAAPVTIYTAYMPIYGQVTGPTGGSLVETKFVGQVTTIEKIGLTQAEITVNDGLYLLNRQVPQKILQASCSWVLYSPGCTAVQSSFTRSNSVGTVVNPYTFNPGSALTPVSPSGTFAQGFLSFTSGKNSGLTYFVTAFTAGSPGVVVLDVAPIFPLNAGDTFTISEGCNKTFSSCLNILGSTNAYKNYGGEPNTPVPETAI